MPTIEAILNFEDNQVKKQLKHNTSDCCDFSVEKRNCWDLPPYREFEDLMEDPDALIGTGEGATLSQGEAAPAVEIPQFCYYFSLIKKIAYTEI